ncbi:C40 family peptidase [Sporichthya brevicatena]|uniref:C40 family peptidase n=1 Tax=Sporichthya brevicatena TaxID=171442 RepID=A0ABP3SA49_9ACTN
MPHLRSAQPVRGLVAVCAAFALVASMQGSVSAAPRLDVNEARRQVETLYHKAEQATERYNEARMALRDAERKFARAQKEASAKQATVAELQRTVGAFAANAYRNGGMDQTLQLVFSDDPEAFIARAASLDALSSREAGALRKVVEARRELQANQTAAAQQLAVVEAQRKALAAEKAEVEKNLRAAREVLNRLEAKERARFDRASRDGNERDLLKNLPLPNPRAAKAIEFALAQIGDRYVWGASGPDGWDCSGLTMVAWSKAGVSLPHSSRMQYATGNKIPRSELQPGDLVYFYSPISHVGIYLGNGRMVHAPNPGRRVEISPISQMPYAGATRP